MTTIRRNWTKRVAEIRTAARICRAYDSDSGNMMQVDPARAFEAWERAARPAHRGHPRAEVDGPRSLQPVLRPDR